MTLPPKPRPNVLNDPDEARRVLTEDAIEAARRGADQAWFDAAMRGVRVLAKKQQYLTSDDVWSWINPLCIRTGDPRAMGAVMRCSFRDHYIEPTREWRSSDRPACHGRPIRIWKSLTYQTCPES